MIDETTDDLGTAPFIPRKRSGTLPAGILKGAIGS